MCFLSIILLVFRPLIVKNSLKIYVYLLSRKKLIISLFLTLDLMVINKSNAAMTHKNYVTAY